MVLCPDKTMKKDVALVLEPSHCVPYLSKMVVKLNLNMLFALVREV